MTSKHLDRMFDRTQSIHAPEFIIFLHTRKTFATDHAQTWLLTCIFLYSSSSAFESGAALNAALYTYIFGFSPEERNTSIRANAVFRCVSVQTNVWISNVFRSEHVPGKTLLHDNQQAYQVCSCDLPSVRPAMFLSIRIRAMLGRQCLSCLGLNSGYTSF